MVQVLLAPRRINPRCLQVPERIGADPNLLPGWRDRQLADPRQRLPILDPLAVGIAVAEAPPGARSLPLCNPIGADDREIRLGVRAKPPALSRQLLQRPAIVAQLGDRPDDLEGSGFEQLVFGEAPG